MDSFIDKLIDEDKVKLTVPSKDISLSYLQKSYKSLKSAKVLLEIENFDDAIALTYYSMYHCALSLLYRCGIKSENHTGTIIILKEIFEIDNRQLYEAKKERIEKQYYIDFHTTQQDLKESIEIAEKFNARLREVIERLTEKDIVGFHEKMKERISH